MRYEITQSTSKLGWWIVRVIKDGELLHLVTFRFFNEIKIFIENHRNNLAIL